MGVPFDRDSVLSALAVAVRAPSIHNTQPWAWRLTESHLQLRADRSRQLAVADPDGHSLLVSCGAALHLTEVGLRAAGWEVATTVLPDPDDPDCLAVFVAQDRTEPTDEAVDLADAALRRRSDRRPFAKQEPSEEILDVLIAAGSGEQVTLDFPARDIDARLQLAAAVSWADRVERNDEAYKAEQNRWVHDPDVHTMVDGVPVNAFPHVDPERPRRQDLPQRDFEIGWTGRQLIEQDVDDKPLIAVVLTPGDGALDHLHGGMAMIRGMLAAELRGLTTCVLSQAVDFAGFRTRVQGLMGWVGYPQMMMRVGYPSGPTSELAVTPRREPSAVLS